MDSSSSSDPRSDSPVDVEIQEALQMISLAEEKDGNDMLFKFHLNEDNLKRILNKIPKDMKVAVVSVVGNFRTGKSFLLTFMLRYLRNRLNFYFVKLILKHRFKESIPFSHCKGTDWQTEEGDTITEGNVNSDARSSEHHSFEWRGGHERMTTGIWMYSEPFFHTSVRSFIDSHILGHPLLNTPPPSPPVEFPN